MTLIKNTYFLIIIIIHININTYVLVIKKSESAIKLFLLSYFFSQQIYRSRRGSFLLQAVFTEEEEDEEEEVHLSRTLEFVMASPGDS